MDGDQWEGGHSGIGRRPAVLPMLESLYRAHILLGGQMNPVTMSSTEGDRGLKAAMRKAVHVEDGHVAQASN